MKHPEIDEQAVVDLYVAGKLSATEVASFEEHYLDCPACIQAVEDAERLQRGLGQAAAEDLIVQQTILAAAWRSLRSGPGITLVTALLMLSLLPASLQWRRAERLDADLDATRQALTKEQQPRINVPILALVATRIGDGEQPRRQISLAPEPEWMVLAIELGDNARAAYSASLETVEGTVVWESSSLEPSFRGTLSLSLHSSLLPPGEYFLHLDSGDHQVTFPLRIVVSSALGPPL